MTKFKLRKKVTKNNLRIISKPHAYLQIMTKTYVKFRKNRHKTVGGVAQTTYIRSTLGGQKDGKTERRTEGQNAGNYVPPLFSKRRGKKVA